MNETYYINKYGIYYTRSCYHDDVESVYVVDFESPDTAKQFDAFIKTIEKRGADKKFADLKKQFAALRDLLG